MSDRLGLPVRVDNDANLGALAEHVWGAGEGVKDMIYLKLATGIGAGLVLGGRLYVGAGGTAGEIGHTIIDEHGPVCRCANRGCLETLASGAATVELLRPTLGADLTLGRVVALTLEGHPAATRVVADAGRHIGRAVANLVNLLNPAASSSAASWRPAATSCSTRCARSAIATRSPAPATTSRSTTAHSATARKCSARSPSSFRTPRPSPRPPATSRRSRRDRSFPSPCPLHLEEERAFHA